MEKHSLRELGETRRTESVNNTRFLVDMLRKKTRQVLGLLPRVEIAVRPTQVSVTSAASPFARPPEETPKERRDRRRYYNK